MGEEMDIEQRETKGGFLKLFDWNAKSRKKLFSNKDELPGKAVLKQGSENVKENGIRTHLVGLHHNGTGPRDKASNDHNFALSVKCGDGYGTRVPGVVAKLMGLDSLPNSNGSESESSATPFCDSPLVGDSHSRRCDSNFQIEHHIKNEVPKFLEPSVQKMQNQKIERPQFKILPPKSAKSAKSIPLPHHRSFPTKSSGFIPTDRIAYTVERGAKIIEQGPSATTPEGRMPCFRPSLSLKEKTDTKHTVSGLPEASRVLEEPNPVIYRKVQDGGRRLTGNTQLSNNSMGSLKNIHESMRRKGLSASIATQAKASIQKKEGFISSSDRSSTSQKEGDLAKPGPNKSQAKTLKGVQKRASTSRTSDVLRKNNQKRNFVTNKDRATSAASVSNQEDRKVPANSGSLRPNKASNKVNSEMGSGYSLGNDTGKELQSSKMKTFSKKKHSVLKDVPFEKILAKNVLINKQERSERYNIGSGGCVNLGAVARKSRMDVISFTFTSPISRSMPGILPSCLDIEKNNHLSSGSCHSYDTHDFKRLSSLGLSVIGGDALNVLLDHKLKELKCKVETSANKFVEAEGTAYSSFGLQESFPDLDVIDTVSSEIEISSEIENSCQLNWHEDQSSWPCDCSSVDNLWLKAKQKCQEFEEMEAHGSDSNASETGKRLDFQHPSSILSLEPSSSGGNCCSLDSKTSCITNRSKHSLLASTCQAVTCIHGRKCLPGAVGKELPDSASSQLDPLMGGNDMVSTTLGLMDFKRSSNSTWELECITKVLCSADFLFEDFILGRVNDLMTPNLFGQLENQKTGLDEDVEQYFELQCEVLIDYVSEWLQLKWERLFGPSCKAWSKWATLIERKQWLAEELYREISSWRNMGALMVDELVYKDMSSWYGRWAHFEIEAFEEGEEIQKRIVTSLIDEVVSDFLPMYSH